MPRQKAKAQRGPKKSANQKHTKKSRTSRNDEYRGEITQDDKKNYWLTGGIFPVGRVLFPSLFTSKLSFNGKEKENKGKATSADDREYSVTLLFKKNDPGLKSLEKKITDLAVLGLNLKSKTQNFHSPIKEGDEKYKDNPEVYELYKGMKYIVLKRPGNLSAPVVLDEYGEEMLSKENFYPGCYAVAQADFKCYTTFGGGVTAYFKGIKKIQDGEKIGFDMTKKVKGDFDSDDAQVSVNPDTGEVVY